MYIDERFCYPVAQDSLELALDIVDIFTVPEPLRKLAEKIIVTYILNQLVKEGCDEVTHDLINKRFSMLIVDRVNCKLAKENLVDVYFDDKKNDFAFSLTDKGEKYFKSSVNSSPLDDFFKTL
jgi:hypothetical protein